MNIKKLKVSITALALLRALTKKTFDRSNIQAGRDFVTAYVEYTHCPSK